MRPEEYRWENPSRCQWRDGNALNNRPINRQCQCWSELDKRVSYKRISRSVIRGNPLDSFMPRLSIQCWQVWTIFRPRLRFTNSTSGPTMAGLRCTNELLPFNEMHLVSSLPSRGYPPFRATGIPIGIMRSEQRGVYCDRRCTGEKLLMLVETRLNAVPDTELCKKAANLWIVGISYSAFCFKRYIVTTSIRVADRQRWIIFESISRR